MRIAAFALITAVALPMAAQAQWLNAFDQLSFDAGLGASYGPGYLGADESDAEPWFILRNVTLGEGGEEKQGFSIIPSLNYIGKRDADDSDDLTALYMKVYIFQRKIASLSRITEVHMFKFDISVCNFRNCIRFVFHFRYFIQNFVDTFRRRFRDHDHNEYECYHHQRTNDL